MIPPFFLHDSPVHNASERKRMTIKGFIFIFLLKFSKNLTTGSQAILNHNGQAICGVAASSGVACFLNEGKKRD
jgi:hypothetical protein